jgi:cytochrome P450
MADNNSDSALSDAPQAARDFQLTRVPADFIEDPYPYYDLLRRYEPVHELEGGALLLTRYEDVVGIYRDPRASSDKKAEFAPKFGDTPLYEHHTTSLVFNDPPLHTRVRRLLMGALNQRAIARMEADVEALVDQLLEQMTARAAPDLIDDFAAQIPVEVIGNLLQVPRAERGPLRGWSLAILSALEPVASRETLERGNRAVSDFLEYLKDLVEERRRRPQDPERDVLTRLIQGESGGERLTQAELLHNSIFLLNAGHETTANLIGNGTHALLVHRGEFERLCREPGLLPSAVEELLRFESPVQLNNRVTTDETEIGGRRVPAGTFLTLGVGAANRDPAQFPNPEQLDVGRKPNRHVAFGQADHACAGMNVARLEARIAIGRMLARFPKLDLAAQPERDPRVRFRGFRHLPVRLN